MGCLVGLGTHPILAAGEVHTGGGLCGLSCRVGLLLVPTTRTGPGVYVRMVAYMECRAAVLPVMAYRAVRVSPYR